MRKSVKTLCAVLVCIFVLSLCPLTAFAEGPIDTGHTCALTVDYSSGGAAIPGAEFSIYKVADVDAYTNFTLCGAFTAYSGTVSLTGHDVDSWNDLAVTLAGLAQADGIAADSHDCTNGTGKCTFPGRATGLYLLTCTATVFGDYVVTADPALVALPSRDPIPEHNAWIYDVTVNPKPHASYVPPVVPVDEKVEYSVLKAWDDADFEDKRPASVTVRLLCDGEVYDTVTLDAGCSWRHTWTELPKYSSAGLLHEWTAAEVPVTGYRMLTELDGTTFLIKNTYDPDIPDDDPGGGDIPGEDDPGGQGGGGEEEGGEDDPSQNLPWTGQYWWPVPVLLCLGVIALTVGAVRRKAE